MIAHCCEVCGNQLPLGAECCPDHPNAMVESIGVRGWADATLFDSNTKEPLSPEDLGLDWEDYAVAVGQSLSTGGTGHIRVRVSPTGATRRVYAA